MNSQPLVSLGMPTYDEEKFIVETLENLLGQTYPNIEIVISDNGSNDRTSEICKEYAAKNSNITFIQQPKNIGQNSNFNELVRKAKGKYFCWIAGHDLMDKDLVEKCVAALEHDPNSVLAYPRTMNVKEDGTHTREKSRHFDIRSMNAEQRFREVMWRVDCNYVYGMWRREPMMQSHIFQLFPAADRVFLSEMALKGTFIPVDTFKYSRANRGGQQEEIEKRHRLMKYIFPEKTFTDAELAGNQFYEPTFKAFHKVVNESDLNALIKLKLHVSVWLCGVMKSHLFPGADFLSVVVKKLLPKPLLRVILRRMQ